MAFILMGTNSVSAKTPKVKKIRWYSSNKKVAKFNFKGIVTAKKNGKGYITAKVKLQKLKI